MAGQQYKAKFDFQATGEGQLSFKKADQFSLVRKTNNDWWTLRSMGGDVGLAPVNYIEAVDYMKSIVTKKAAYTTLYDYKAQDCTQLSFQQGEILTLVDKTDVSWWQMKSSSGKLGLVPVNYIDKLDTADEKRVDNSTSPTPHLNGTKTEQESVLLSIDTQIEKIHNTAIANGGTYTKEMRSTLQRLVAHRQSYVNSQKQQQQSAPNHTPSSPEKTLTQLAKSPYSSPNHVKKSLSGGSPRAKRQAPPPPNDPNRNRTQSQSGIVRREKNLKINALKDNRYSLQVNSSVDPEQFRQQFGSLPRQSAPPPPNRRDSLSGSASTSKPPHHPSSPQKTNYKEADIYSASTFSPTSSVASLSTLERRSSTGTTDALPQTTSISQRQRSVSMSSNGSRTLDTRRRVDSGSSSGSRLSHSRSSSREKILEPKLQLPTSFPKSDGSELVESIRKQTAVSYRKTLLAVSGVLEFLKDKVPACAEMVDGLMTAVNQSQVDNSPSMMRKAEASSDLGRLREIFFEITECKNDSQQRGWAVHDDQQAIVDILEELLQILCDANPDISKAAIEEDKYENILTLITYYQMENRVPIRLLLLKVFGVLCGLDQTVVGVLLSSVLPNELGRDIQQDLTQIQKTLYSCTVSTMIFSTGDSVPLPVYDQWSEDYVLFLMNTIENILPEDEEERVADAFLNMILAFNQHFPDPTTNLVMSAVRRCPNPRNFSEKLMFLFNRGEDPVAISKPCCPDSMTKFLLDLFSDKETSGLFYTTDLMVLIDIVSRQIADLGPEDEPRVHYLELLFRIVATTNYSEHKHRQHELVTSLNRIAQEENAKGTRDYELVRKIWKNYPEIFEEITDL